MQEIKNLNEIELDEEYIILRIPKSCVDLTLNCKIMMGGRTCKCY